MGELHLLTTIASNLHSFHDLRISTYISIRYATLPRESHQPDFQALLLRTHQRHAEEQNSLPTIRPRRLVCHYSESFSSAWTLNSYAISKHSASKAFKLPCPSGMSEPTKNLPSTRILSIEFSYANLDAKSFQRFPVPGL